MPEMRKDLLPAMLVMTVSMAAFIGLPSCLVEFYGSGVKKSCRAGGLPMWLCMLTSALSALIHLLLMSGLLCLLAPLLFQAALPESWVPFLTGLLLYIAASLALGCVLGLLVKSQAKLSMYAQLLFLPSILLSGALFPAALLPAPLVWLGKCFPGAWGFALMQAGGFHLENLWYFPVILLLALLVCALRLRALQRA